LNNNNNNTALKQLIKNEFKEGVTKGKYIGPNYPKCVDSNNKEQPIDEFTHSLYIDDKIRIEFPIKNLIENNGGIKKIYALKRCVGNNIFKDLPDDFQILTGSYGNVIEYDDANGLVFTFDSQESAKYLSKYNLQPIDFTLKVDGESRNISNLTISIQNTKKLKFPMLKSEFYNHPIKEKQLNIYVDNIVPISKASASTIHSLQGQTYDKSTDVWYFMTSKIQRDDLQYMIEDKCGPFKAQRCNYLYTAITRSKYPSTNFKLYTSAKNMSELKKLFIASNKEPNSYRNIHSFQKLF